MNCVCLQCMNLNINCFRVAVKTGSVELIREISAVINNFQESTANPDDIRKAVVNIFTESR